MTAVINLGGNHEQCRSGLCGVTQEASHIVNPNFVVTAADNWFFMIASTFLLTAVGVFVNDKIITPRLGAYQGETQEAERVATEVEHKALKKAGLFTLGYLALLVVTILPYPGLLLGKGGTIIPSPFIDGLVPILIVYFILVGVVYGKAAGTLKSANDVPGIMAKALTPLTGYIVLVFIIAQFIALFGYTNLGMIIAVKSADVLKTAGFTGIPLIISMILLTTTVNLFMSSGTAKWYIFAPIFVPMLMLLGYSPAFAQAIYRIGDSCTNPITPIYAYMPIIIGMAQKYEKNVGMGTIISLMMPYSFAFLIVWIILVIAWMALGLPLGPGVSCFYPG